MKKIIILILIIFNLFNINKSIAGQKKEYVYIVSLSDRLVARDMEDGINVGIKGAINLYEPNERVFYTRADCLDKIMDLILNKNYDVDYYISGGLFINSWSNAYGRYFCVKYKDIEKYVNKKYFNLSFKDFNKGENKNMPLFVDEKTIQEVYNSLFPLDKDQKEAVKITKKFDKEIHDIFKQRQREQDIKLIKENDLKPSFNCDNIDKLNDIEIEICKNNSLSKKDVELNKLYKEILLKCKNNNNKEKIKQLKQEQREWIKSLTINNLYQSYNQRVEELKIINNK